MVMKMLSNWVRKPQAEVVGVKDYQVVVHVPGRMFPALAVQGDVLLEWREDTSEILKRARASGDRELISWCTALREEIASCFDSYNDVCKESDRGGFPDGLEKRY